MINNVSLNTYVQLLKELARHNRCVSRDRLDELIRLDQKLEEYIEVSNTLAGEVCFKTLVPIALRALEYGADPYVISETLDWKDFEKLVLHYLSLADYEVIHSLKTFGKRYEIDVVAVNPITKVGLAIDCKHWSPGYSKKSKLEQVASNHRVKTEFIVRECWNLRNKYRILEKARYFTPVIVTLTEVLKEPRKGCFIVPIGVFRDFIINVQYYIDLLSKEVPLIPNPCYIP